MHGAVVKFGNWQLDSDTPIVAPYRFEWPSSVHYACAILLASTPACLCQVVDNSVVEALSMWGAQ